MEKTPETLKILELIDTYYPVVDGAINVTKHYCEELNKIAECKLAVPKAAKKDKYEDKETFDVIRCASTSAPEKYRSAFPEQDLRFKRRIREEKFDIMHTHSPFVLGRYALKTARKRGIPIVATLHTQYHQDFERVLKNKALTDFMIWYIVKVFQDADSVWTVSNRSCQILRDYGYNGKIAITLKYADKKSVINGLQRRSKPGLRVYAGVEDMPKVLGGLGTVILSTNKGVLTGKQAKALNVGGEVLAFVW